MAEKSSKRSMSKKPGRTIKEKRAERRSKLDGGSEMDQLTSRKRG